MARFRSNVPVSSNYIKGINMKKGTKEGRKGERKRTKKEKGNMKDKI